MSPWGFGSLISSLKRTRRTWAGQGGSDSEGEKEVANIFTVYTNHRDSIFPLQFLSFSLPNQSFVGHTHSSILVPQFREQNVGDMKCNIAITQSLTDKSLLPRFSLVETWQPKIGVVRARLRPQPTSVWVNRLFGSYFL